MKTLSLGVIALVAAALGAAVGAESAFGKSVADGRVLSRTADGVRFSFNLPRSWGAGTTLSASATAASTSTGTRKDHKLLRL